MTLTAPRDGWQQRAACSGAEVDWWFAGAVADNAHATRICAGCPVVVDCLLFAFAHDSPDNRAECGLWGGCGARARRYGAAAHSIGGDTWHGALHDHLRWLEVQQGQRRDRLDAHPWNRSGRERLTHGTVGAYNHCTSGPGRRQCAECRMAKAIDGGIRQGRARGAAA